MLLFAALAAATPPQHARITVRIERAVRINKETWEREKRWRELVVREGERKVTVRLIEFE